MPHGGSSPAGAGGGASCRISALGMKDPPGDGREGGAAPGSYAWVGGSCGRVDAVAGSLRLMRAR